MKKRLLSILLALAMLSGLVPFGALDVGAVVVNVSNYADLKAALESKEDTYIIVDTFKYSGGAGYERLYCNNHYTADSAAITVPSGYEKTLVLGCDVDFRAVETSPKKKLYSFIKNEGELNISGTGTLAVSFNSTDCPNAIIYQEYRINGKDHPLKISGVTLDATQRVTSTYGYAVYSKDSHVKIGSSTLIGDSRYAGQSVVAAVYSEFTLDYSGSVDVYGGTLRATSSTKATPYGLYLVDNGETYYSGAIFKGGTFHGIYCKNNYVGNLPYNNENWDEYYHYTCNGKEYDPYDMRETTDILTVVEGQPMEISLPAYVSDIGYLKAAMESSVETVIVTNDIIASYPGISFPEYAYNNGSDLYLSLIGVWGTKTLINNSKIRIYVDDNFSPPEDSVYDSITFSGIFCLDEGSNLTMNGEGSFTMAVQSSRGYFQGGSMDCHPCVVYLNGGSFTLNGGTIGGDVNFIRFPAKNTLNHYATAIDVGLGGGTAYIYGGTLQGAARGRERYDGGNSAVNYFTSSVIRIDERLEEIDYTIILDGCEVKSCLTDSVETQYIVNTGPLQMGWVGNYGRTANGDEMWVGAARWNEIIIEDAVFSLEQYHGVDYITKNDVDYYLIHPMKELLPDDRYTVKGDDGFSVRVRRDSNCLEFENLSPEPTEEELEAGYKDLGTVSLGTSEVDFDITFGVADLPRDMIEDGYSTVCCVYFERNYSTFASFASYAGGGSRNFADYADVAGKYTVSVYIWLYYKGEVWETKSFAYKVNVVSPEMVSSVDVSVAAPSIGSIGRAATTTDEGITVFSTKWQKLVNGTYIDMLPDETFVENNTYRPVVTVYAKSGYFFKDGSIAKLSGADAHIISKTSKVMEITRTYMAEEPYVNVLINAPLVTQTVANNNISGSARIDSNYRTVQILSAKWFDVNGNEFKGTFAAGGKYTARIIVKPAVGSFSGDTIFKINGKTATVKSIHPVDKYAVITYQYWLGSSYIAITNLKAPEVYTEATTPSYTKTVSDNNKNLSFSAVWLDGEGNEFTGTFRPGQKYTARINFAAIGGGKVSHYSVIVNGKNPSKVESASSNSKAVYYDFVLSDDVVYFTSDSANIAGGTMTVDIERTAEQNDEMMEALFNDEITYQWYKNGKEISGQKEFPEPLPRQI